MKNLMYITLLLSSLNIVAMEGEYNKNKTAYSERFAKLYTLAQQLDDLIKKDKELDSEITVFKNKHWEQEPKKLIQQFREVHAQVNKTGEQFIQEQQDKFNCVPCKFELGTNTKFGKCLRKNNFWIGKESWNSVQCTDCVKLMEEVYEQNGEVKP